MAQDSKQIFNYIAQISFNGTVLGFTSDGFSVDFEREVGSITPPEHSLPTNVFIGSEYPTAATVLLQTDLDTFKKALGATPGDFLRGEEITARAGKLIISPLYGDGHTFTIEKAMAEIVGPVIIGRSSIVSIPMSFIPIAGGAYNAANWSMSVVGDGGTGSTTRWTVYSKIKGYIIGHYTQSCYISSSLDESYIPGMRVPAIIIEEDVVSSNFEDSRLLDASLTLSIYEFRPRDPHGEFTSSVISSLVTSLTDDFKDMELAIPGLNVNGYIENSSPPMPVRGNKMMLKSQIGLRVFITEI